MFTALFLIFVVCPSSIQAINGVILSLPPISEVATKKPAVKSTHHGRTPIIHSQNIHTWNHQKVGYQLECNVSSIPNQYTVRVLFKKLPLDTIEVTKFDGELTQSVGIWSRIDKEHIVDYILIGNLCKRRIYTESDDSTNIKSKTEETCVVPVESLITKHFHKNGWIWGEGMFETWSSKNSLLWGGAVMELPLVDAKVDLALNKAFKIHTWNNIVDGYQMLVYRVVKNKEHQDYVAMYFQNKLLQSGIKIRRFDDDLHNSITIITPTKNSHHIAYKLHDGQCKEREYLKTTPTAKPVSPPSIQVVKETDCYQFTVYKVFNHLNNEGSVNGWKY